MMIMVCARVFECSLLMLHLIAPYRDYTPLCYDISRHVMQY